ncbi:EmrB/QacA subfamily drug resistance transporter [Streptomyces sp. 2132.2]|uniref:MFS transporter n=1 Tax=Streptomyces sp. 2132.2 TaxID=2485161 RepID=UPI000F4997C1|nr:MFS transporter [Streptomyces sp. 2132.2]ROQ88784.1 EmrB/QacA subfamily drug resistance transporter [Streptomyces sp. 2132.2]
MSASVIERPATAEGGAPGTSVPRPGLALAVIAGCNAMIQLDDPIMNIALPGIRADLGLSALAASWVIGAYLLAFGGLLLLGGRAGDILGRRKVFVAGVALFTAAAAVRAVVPSGELLIAVRAVEGAGAACAAANGFVLMLSTFAEGPARKRAIAVCTAVGAASTAGGLLLAGALTSAGSWRWVLLLNVPMGLAIALLAPRVIAETGRIRGRLDLRGALLSALGAAALVYGLSQAAEHPWSDVLVAGPLLAGLVLLCVFVGTQRRAAQPIVRLGLFRDRDRALAFASMLVLPGGLIGAYFFLSQFFQQHHGWSPLEAAFGLLPVPVTMAAVAGVGVRVERAIGPRPMMAIGTAALIAENLWLSRLGPTDAYLTGVLPGLLLLGAGMAFCVIPPTVLATSGLRPEELGSAASVLNALQSVGGSLCIALMVTASAGRADFADTMSAGFTAGAAFAGAALLIALCLRPRRPQPRRP